MKPYLEIYSRTGHFNYADPSEESISMSIRVFDEKGDCIKSCSIHPEYEYQTKDFDPQTIAEEVAQMIEDYQKKLWFSSSRQKDLEIATWLRENKDLIAEGNEEQEDKRLLKKRDDLKKELETIEKIILERQITGECEDTSRFGI